MGDHPLLFGNEEAKAQKITLDIHVPIIIHHIQAKDLFIILIYYVDDHKRVNKSFLSTNGT